MIEMLWSQYTQSLNLYQLDDFLQKVFTCQKIQLAIFTFVWSLLLLEGFAPSQSISISIEIKFDMNGKYDIFLLIKNTFTAGF